MYYIPETKQVVNSYQLLRYVYANISLPQNVNIPELGVYILHVDEIPNYDPLTQNLEVDSIDFREDGYYHQSWKITSAEV